MFSAYIKSRLGLVLGCIAFFSFRSFFSLSLLHTDSYFVCAYDNRVCPQKLLPLICWSSVSGLVDLPVSSSTFRSFTVTSETVPLAIWYFSFDEKKRIKEISNSFLPVKLQMSFCKSPWKTLWTLESRANHNRYPVITGKCSSGTRAKLVGWYEKILYILVKATMLVSLGKDHILYQWLMVGWHLCQV